jgi:hypothetical protein
VSAARPLFSLLSAGAAVALALAAPGTALADPGGPGTGGEQAGGRHGGQAASSQGNGPQGNGPQGNGAQGNGAQGNGAQGNGAQGNGAQGNGAQGNDGRDADRSDAARGPAPARSTQAASGEQRRRQAGPAPADGERVRPAAAPPDGSGDPAGNNGTIKIDTVPADADRANRPHPGCAFVLQFFGFDAGQTADITFTGQAPTRSAGPLLSLSGQLISTTPADGALEEGHSLTLTAADLGLVGTPTAAQGWHVKVAVDALEAPGGAKQKVFWLDCSSDTATVTEQPDEPAAEQDDATAADTTVVGATGKDADVRGAQLEQSEAGLFTGSGAAVAVLSGAANRGAGAGGASVSGKTGAGTGDVAAAAASAGGPESSVLPLALPFTGPAALAAMAAAGLGAVGAGALAVRAARRRTAGSATS